jgi:capsular exopolysaccharide synthesis family protein
MYIRYAPRVFQSSATILYVSEKKSQILGVDKITQEQDQGEINREIQLIRSQKMVERIYNKLPLRVAYFKEGKTKLVSSDLYLSSPFRVEEVPGYTRIENQPVYINIINQNSFSIQYSHPSGDFEKVYNFGDLVVTPLFRAYVKKNLRKFSKDNLSSIYYFKFMDKDAVIQDIIDKIKVTNLDVKTKSVTIQYADKNEEKTQNITQKLADEFVLYDVEHKRESFSGILKFISDQIDTFSQNFGEFEDSISHLRSVSGYADETITTKLSSDNDRLDDEIKVLNSDLITLHWFRTFVANNKNHDNIPLVHFKSENLNFDEAITELNNLQDIRNTELLDVTSDHPKIKLLDQKIEDRQSELLRNIDNVLAATVEEAGKISSEYSVVASRLFKMPLLESEFNRLDKIRESREKFFLSLIDQKASYQIANAGVVSDYVILAKAFLPNKPISPQVTTIRLSGLMIGILLGLILVIIRYVLHKTIISIQEISFKSKGPILGIIPSYNESLERSQIVVTKDPKSTISEAYRALRANFQFIDNTPGPKTISTTSTIPGEGKTFTALNIAAILGMLDKKVIIIDCDMRKPRLNKIFESDNSKGVSTLLSGQSKVDDCILHTNIVNIDFIPSGPVPPNPSELILLPSLKVMIEYLKTKYDFVIIDTPPIGLVTDALEILRLSDFPVYILRAAFSNRSFILNINKLIDDNKITRLSCVLNDFGRGASSYG